MTLSRRGFLRGVLTVAAVSALPITAKALQTLPVLHGDGIADDLPALQAFVDGKPFRTLDGFAGVVSEGRIYGGRFRLSGALEIRNSKLLLIENCIFTNTPDGEPFVTDSWRINAPQV